MIIIRTQDGSEFFAASKKVVPGLVQEIAGDAGIEPTVQSCEYFEFNTRENRTGLVGPFVPLANLVVVSCGLAPTAGASDDDEEEEENGDAE